MANALQRLLIAGAVSGAAIQGGAALAQDREVVLTEQQQIAVDLVREYNTCVAAEDTPQRNEAIRIYAEAVVKIQAEFDAEYETWKKTSEAYAREFVRIMEEHDIDRGFGVPGNYPQLATEIEFANIDAIDQRISELLEKETGLTRPQYPQPHHERIQALGEEPQRAVDLCSDRLSPKFGEAGIDIDWDLRAILSDVIKEQGAEAYLDLVSPEAP